jgi:pimeloyl-ACP methyl ester carboxylesterase
MPRTDPATAPERLVKWLDAQVKSPRFRDYASFDEVAVRLKRNNPRLADDKAQFLARHWARENGAGRVEMLSDPRHKAANPYLFRVEEALACWRRVTAPTLLVSGKDSHIIAWLKDVPEEVAERKKAFRDLRDVVLEDCGHMIHHDQPERLAAVVEEFMAP